MRRTGPTQTNLKYTASLLLPGVGEFPGSVFDGKTVRARSISGGDSRFTIHEKDAVPDIATFGDRSQSGRAVEASVDPGAAMSTQRTRSFGQIRPSVGTDQFPRLRRFHPVLVSTCTKAMTR